MSIQLLVLDVMKPHNPTVIEYAKSLMDIEGVLGVNIIAIEVDKEVENIELHIHGEDLDFELIQDEIRELAGAIHSVDQVIAGEISAPLSLVNAD